MSLVGRFRGVRLLVLSGEVSRGRIVCILAGDPCP